MTLLGWTCVRPAAGRERWIAVLVVAALITAAVFGGPAGRLRRPPAAFAGVALSALGPGAGPAQMLHQPPALPAGTRRHVVRWRAGRLWRELIDVAPVISRGALPLVVVLHGRRQTPWRAEATERWDEIAAAGRAVVAYGAGYAGSWDAGSCCGSAARHRLDDTGYVLRLIRLEEHQHLIDRHRVFLVGFSNGGMLAYTFACTHARVISALAVVDGSLQTPDCRPARALAVLDVQGASDRVVPYGGSRFSRAAGAPTRSIPDSLRPWQRIARPPGLVRLVLLPGLGHQWPTPRHGGWDATAHIWRFLQQHPAATA